MPGGAQLEPHTLNQLLSSVIGTVAVAAAPGTCVSLLANRVGSQAHKFSDCPLRGLHGSPGSTPPGAGGSQTQSKLGKINHLLVDKVSTQVPVVVLLSKGFLGLGHSHCELDWPSP